MPSISVCMIVKNEEENLERCLKSLYDLTDEVVIVDTGSTDRTKEIAAKYTSRIYDFDWIDDFSAARNFAFKKASMEYIYSADADEVLDEENRKKFRQLKENLLPEIEIVQMLYVEKGISTVMNEEKELRPKLFKRERTFSWVDPIHETIRLTPIVFDSDIEILHCPSELHANRDFEIFEKAYKRDGYLSENILRMYARELYKWGDEDELAAGLSVFSDLDDRMKVPSSIMAEIYTTCAKAALANDEPLTMMKYVTKVLSAGEPCAELCMVLAEHYDNEEDYPEASLWLINALYETECIMDSSIKSDENRVKLIHFLNYAADQMDQKGLSDQQEHYLDLVTQYEKELFPNRKEEE